MAPPTWKRYRPDPTPEGEPDPSASTQPKAESRQPPSRPKQQKPVRSLEERTVRRRGRLLMVGVVAVGLATWGVVAIVRSILAPDEPQTVEGFAALLEDLDEETGATEVFRAVIYPDYAVVEVPLGPGDRRYDSYRWDGGLTESSKGNNPDDQPFDLGDVDPAPFLSMCADARELVPDTLTCYLVVEKPEDGGRGWISAYVSNDYRQGGYIKYDLAGDEVGRTSW